MEGQMYGCMDKGQNHSSDYKGSVTIRKGITHKIHGFLKCLCERLPVENVCSLCLRTATKQPYTITVSKKSRTMSHRERKAV